MLATPEGRILLAGTLVGVLYVVWLALSYVFARAHFNAYVGMTVTHIFFGRAAGMSLGYALDYGHAVVVPVNLAIETVAVLLFYPVFALGVRRLVVFRALGRFVGRVHELAEANQGKIRRYGIPGLFLFVFIPFWMTGPLVGSAIGFLLGLRPWLNMTVVLGGTYVAVGAWALILRHVRDRAAAASPLAPLLLVAAVIAVVVLGNLLARPRREKPKQE